MRRSGYDHVLLLQFLVPLLFEQGLRPRIEKRGNRVTTIGVSKLGVKFRDVSKLLAPSTNLRKFGQLFSLEQCKAHFPFAALTSVRDLERTELPVEDRYWRSELGGAKQTGEELAVIKKEAKELFQKANCQNMGDYLRTYLLLDVDILYKSTQAWRRQLKSVIGLDFVECKKFTISSLSYTAGLKNMEANRRLGHFFPNNSQMYRLLRMGMRG